MKLYQYWDTGSPPDEVMGWIEGVKAKNPALQHRFYDRGRAAWFIGKQLGARHQRAFEACAVPAMQADYFRVCALWAKGGLYVDADYKPMRRLDGLFDLTPAPFMFSHENSLTSGVMCFPAARDAFLEAVLELTTDNIEARRFDHVFVATGPPLYDAIRALLDRPWLTQRLAELDDFGRAMRFGALLDRARALIPLTDRLRTDFARIRILDLDQVKPWLFGQRARYKQTELDWRRWQGSIYLDRAGP